MAVVKCPNCGANARDRGELITCEYCGGYVESKLAKSQPTSASRPTIPTTPPVYKPPVYKPPVYNPPPPPPPSHNKRRRSSFGIIIAFIVVVYALIQACSMFSTVFDDDDDEWYFSDEWAQTGYISVSNSRLDYTSYTGYYQVEVSANIYSTKPDGIYSMEVKIYSNSGKLLETVNSIVWLEKYDTTVFTHYLALYDHDHKPSYCSITPVY